METKNKIGFSFCFLIGFLLMGSDGGWFPYINFIGAVIFSGCVYFAKEV